MTTSDLTTMPPRRGAASHVVIEHVRDLMAQRPGSTVLDVARASGVSEKTLRNLLSPTAQRPTVYAPTAEKLLRTTPQDLRVVDRRLVDGTKARRMVERLLEQGYSLEEIASTAEVSVSTLAAGNMASVYMDTALRVQRTFYRLNGKRPSPALVPGHRMSRMVQALLVLGWRREDIARASGVSHSSLSPGDRLVMVENEQAVARVFERMKYKMGPSETTRRRARVLGYAPWAAWSARTMADPQGKPDLAWVDDKEWRAAIARRYA